MASSQVERLQIGDLWQTTRGAGVRIAVLDTGVTHSTALPEPRVEAVESDGSPQAFTASSHGTSCASLIASSLSGAEGMAPEGAVLSIRVTSSNDRPSLRRVKQGLRLALERSCDLISCSFTLPRADEELRELVREAHVAGVPLVAATGNDPEDEDEFPHVVPHALVIGAIDGANERMVGRHTIWTDVFCLGDELDVADGNGSIVRWSGHSSGATALVAGIIALAFAPLTSRRRRRAGLLVDGLLKSTALERNASGSRSRERSLHVAPARLFAAIQECP